MGLDIFVYRVKKIHLVAKKPRTLEDARNEGWDSFCKENEDPELVDELLPYCQEVKVKAPIIDVDKIKEVYGLGKNSYISMRDGDGTLGFTDPDDVKEREGGKATARYVRVDGSEIEQNFVSEKIITLLAYEREEVAYWRKDHDVQDFFHDNIDEIQNTQWCILSKEVLEKFNNSGISETVLPEEDPTDEEALFYYEWY